MYITLAHTQKSLSLTKNLHIEFGTMGRAQIGTMCKNTPLTPSWFGYNSNINEKDPTVLGTSEVSIFKD